MSRIKIVNGVVTALTAAEELQRDAEEAAATAEQRIRDANAYKVKRAAAYPPMADYLDGIVKNDQAQIAKYIADCLAVKAKYPKT